MTRRTPLFIAVLVICVRAVENTSGPASSDVDDPYAYLRLSAAKAQRGPRCPRPCLCGTGTSQPPLSVKGYFAAASCVNRKLTSFPVGLPFDIRILIARGNALSLAAIPSGAPTNLSELDFSYNQITVVNFSTLSNDSSNLRHINLNHNHIEHVSADGFRSSALNALEVLLLGHNRIGSIAPGCFSSLVNLRWLKLTGNRLESLGVDAFGGLPALAALELDRNRFWQIGDGDDVDGDDGANRRPKQSPKAPSPSLRLPDTLPALRMLNVAHNRIDRVSRSAFVGVASAVEQLDLSFNRLRSVPGDALRRASFRRLQKLSLDGNPMRTLTTRCLERVSVAEVSFSNMPLLVSVEPHALVDIVRLTSISIHDNRRLVYVDAEAVGRSPLSTSSSSDGGTSIVAGDSSIRRLELHRNRLTVLEPTLVTTSWTSKLEVLTLYGNPLRCDCHADWLRVQLRTGGSQLQIVLNDKRTDSMPCADFNSSTSATKSGGHRTHRAAGRAVNVSAIAITVSASGLNSTSLPTSLFPDRTSSESTPAVAETPPPFPSDVPALSGYDRNVTSLIDPAVTCLPVIVVSSRHFYGAIGENVELDCHVVGRSLTSGGYSDIHWVLPGEKIINMTDVNNSRLRLIATRSLVLSGVKPTDAGNYRCTVSSLTSDNRLEVAVRLSVYSASAHIGVVAVGAQYVSVTWSGLETTVISGSAQYMLVYRPVSGNDQTVSIRHESRFESGEHGYDKADNRNVDDGDDGDDNDSGSVWKVRRAASTTNGTWCDAPVVGDECIPSVLGPSMSSSTSTAPVPLATDRSTVVYRKSTEIRPYMRGFWIGGLASGTRYEFCVGLVRDDVDDDGGGGRIIGEHRPAGVLTIQLINCSAVTTTSRHRGLGVGHAGDGKLFDDGLSKDDLVVVFVTSGVFAFVCLVPGLIGLLGTVIRRRQRRKHYIEPVGTTGDSRQRQTTVTDLTDEDQLSIGYRFGSAVDRIARAGDDLSPVGSIFGVGRYSLSSIPLDNLYQVAQQGTQLTTSRTTLIS